MWNKLVLCTLLLYFGKLCYGVTTHETEQHSPRNPKSKDIIHFGPRKKKCRPEKKNVIVGRDNSEQQRHSSNTDFLLHETGTNTHSERKSYEFSSNPGKRDYAAQFPALKTPTTSSTTVKSVDKLSKINSQASGKRDYVAPQFPPLQPQGQDLTNAGKRYFQSPPTISTTTKSVHTSTRTTTSQASGKRDYVAPQFLPLKPQSQDSTGRVKDLVNFFDSKSGNNSNPNVPSYSSILQGSSGTVKTGSNAPSKNNNFGQHVTQRTPSSPSRSNMNKPKESGSLATFTTQKKIKPQKPTTGKYQPAATPTTPVVLPSAINNNGNNNQVRTVSDPDIQSLSEELLRKDANNAAKYITINYQEKTTSYSSEDKAPNPLLNIAAEAWNIPTIQKFVPLLDNYERDTLINEYVTPQERNEENAFMDAIMSTSVIRHLMNFLKDKGFVTPDPRQQRDFLKQLWFSLYSRGKGKLSSSGFEHIFVSEFKNGEVSGLHNWIYFSKEETANRVNYLGYLKYVQLDQKGVVMKLHFNQQGIDKPVDSMFIGTSPELEIALYTLCFVTRADNDCKLKLANKDVKIVTHTFRYRSKNLIGSAYPQI